MRPTLLLTSFLAVLPVSLICLSLNPRIHTICSQVISATPSLAEPARMTDPTFVPLVPVNIGISYTWKGCRQ